MMETIAPPSSPTLSAATSNTQISLSWNTVAGAASYKLKRASTAGGPYTTIAENVTSAAYTDTGLTNGTTYYYVVTAVNSAGESTNSNEASATPQAPGGNKAILVITMTNGMEKEYDLAISEVNAFISWYDGKASGTGKAYYTISKTFNKGPFLSRKDNIVFDKIMTFEVNEYNE
ncbi:MAG: fibronectin type III domain-containing protein [Deltaproteobacteria bacterium]